MTPYTAEGRKTYVNYRKRNKPLPLDRPSINTASSLKYSLYSNNKMNFEYYMNREYAFNRDRGKCRCCKVDLWDNDDKRCHHVNNRLPLNAINKVPNLAWVCNNCHRMIHNSPIPDEIDKKVLKRIIIFKNKLEKAKS